MAGASAGQAGNTLRRYTPAPCPVHGRPDVSARASWVETQATVVPMAVLESEVIVIAGRREAMCRFISDPRVPENTLLVAGQTRFDSTQIVDGAFFDSEPLAADIHAICAR